MEHHKRLEYCRTRLQYRQGRDLKAVKVYTVASESRYLLVFGVPRINLQANIKNKLQLFGKLQSITCVTSEMAAIMELEAFTDVYKVIFYKLENARRAKRKLDATEFYGGILHISYAPENETTFDLCQKIQQRRKEVAFRIQYNKRNRTDTTYQS
ncbi:RNA-binding protein 48 [Scaptodrosophila lebanonensis]|uniref:RNA-binding protein 48 n=1 Tax=Drosophila lebanonensis TaxID=7225 RepID=A0A6J2T4P3_DROLE|nr:RNA-binding protein 48 [Scaptodrosophila lebanonensis]